MKHSLDHNLSLLQGLRTGEQWAINDIFIQLRPEMMAFANKFLPHRLSEEIIIDVFMRAISYKDRNFHSMEHLRGYLFRGIKNTSINMINRDDLHYKHLLRYITMQPTTTGETEEDAQLERLEPVFNAAEHLPPSCKNIFKMLYVHGLKYEEIAEQLKLSHKTVRAQKDKAIFKIKQMIKNDTSRILSNH